MITRSAPRRKKILNWPTQPILIPEIQEDWQASKLFDDLMSRVKQVSVILYSKPGCHLCEVMKAELQKAGCDKFYTFAEVDINSSPKLLDRYRFDIPVLNIEGRDVFKHRLRAEEFKAYLSDVLGLTKTD